MAKAFNSFSDFLENAGMEFEKTVETISRQDENIANNRLFVWNFEAVDLQEMVDIFEVFQRNVSRMYVVCFQGHQSKAAK